MELCIERKHVGERLITFDYIFSRWPVNSDPQLAAGIPFVTFLGVVVNGAISTLGSHLHQHNGPIHPVHSSLSPHPSRGQPCRKKLKRPLHRGFAIAAPSPACDALWLISFLLPSSQVFLMLPIKYLWYSALINVWNSCSVFIKFSGSTNVLCTMEQKGTRGHLR